MLFNKIYQSFMGSFLEESEYEKGIETIFDRNQLNNPYNDYGYKYKGFQLEVEKDEEQGERYFYFSQLFDPEGKQMTDPETNLVSSFGDLDAEKFKDYIDNIIK